MAGGGFTTASGDTQFEAKITFTVIISCIMAATGGLMFGYDIGISGTLHIYNLYMTLFLKFFFFITFKIKLTNELIIANV